MIRWFLIFTLFTHEPGYPKGYAFNTPSLDACVAKLNEFIDETWIFELHPGYEGTVTITKDDMGVTIKEISCEAIVFKNLGDPGE